MNMDLHKNDYATNTPLSDGKKAFLLCCIMGTLLLLRALNNFFVYPAFIFGLFAVIVTKPSTSLCMLFFILPLATIFKLSSDSLSLFTILFIVFVLKLLFTRPINIKIFLSIYLLGFYLIIFSGIDQIINIATIILGFLLVYYSLRDRSVSYKNIIISYSFGLLEASVLGLMREQFPIVNEYVLDLITKLNEGNYINRFSGLHGNPNYFTVDIIIVLSGLALILMKNKSSILNMILFASLSIIGFLSLSRSYLLAWAILLLWMFISSFQLDVTKFIKTILIVICSFAVIYLFAANSINLYLIRFFDNATNSVSDMTAGRTDIWVTYLNEIFSNIKTLFLGAGIGGDLVGGKGAHNTYIEVLYMLGIFGGFLYVFTTYNCLKIKNQKILLIQYSPLLILLVRFFAVGTLLYDSIWFYMIVAGLALRENKRR